MLAGWTAFVWVTRIVNVFGDDEQSAGVVVRELIAPLIFLVVAAWVAWVALARRERLPQAISVLGAWTLIAWLVSLPGIAFGGHGAAFVIVHSGLAVVSVGLCVLANESGAKASRSSAPAAADG